ncbi:Git3 domain-containing protein [Favolaschia claudopus]|uniref:Git3 domain-containing protein n=1 Tax=Favolaschia claudopus TaxID=2862362 RepID=A0AAW0AFL9_9AGAR
MLETTVTLPDGSEKLLRLEYDSSSIVPGVTALVVISCLSLIAVVGLLLAIAISAFNTRSSRDQYLFVRTHVAAYFLSLLLSDIIQAVGSIMNVKWVQERAVSVGDVCTIQGILKQTADVATAWWTLVIAAHTFCVLFLDLKPNRIALLATFVGGWAFIGATVILGPAALDTTRHGPFFGISGYWCWIAPAYPTPRIVLDYLFMFVAAAFSFLLYTLVFLRLRGNIVMDRGRVSFHRTGVSLGVSSYRGQQLENRTSSISKKMLLYPVAYTIMILPIAASRFSSFAGQDVPFAVTMFADAVFLLSGVVNVVLFGMTRRILPSDSVNLVKWIRRRSQPQSQSMTGVSVTIELTRDSFHHPSTAGSSDETKEDAESRIGMGERKVGSM